MAHILLVDDQSSMRLTLTALLKQAGHTLMQAGTGADAMEKIEKNDFDIVITDLKLDQISGMDVLKAAKTNNPQTEVIMLTGYGSVETAVDSDESRRHRLPHQAHRYRRTVAGRWHAPGTPAPQTGSRALALGSRRQKFDSGNIVACSEPMQRSAGNGRSASRRPMPRF